MKAELNAKFIQHLSNRKRTAAGFTLIELLVVILILGILVTVAIPNFLNQEVKAKQSEAKRNIALVNKGQNSYRAEKSFFASSFDILAIGGVSGGTTGTTHNYNYTIAGNSDTATIIATPNDSILKGYSGGAIYYNNSANLSVVSTVICEMQSPGTTAPALTTFSASGVTCTGLQTNLSI